MVENKVKQSQSKFLGFSCFFYLVISKYSINAEWVNELLYDKTIEFDGALEVI